MTLNQHVWISVSRRGYMHFVMHVQRSVKSVMSVERKAKRMYYRYVERVRQCKRVFEPHRMRGYGRFLRRPRALFASLGAAALSRTHRSRHGLHGVVAAFTLSLLFRFRARLLPFFLAPITIFAI